MNTRKKFFIITTIPISLGFFEGLYRKLAENYDVCVVSSPGELLYEVGKNEGIRTYALPMEREVSLMKDILSFLRFIVFFGKERPYVVHGNTPKASLLSMVTAWLMRVPHRMYMCHGLRYQSCCGVKRKLLMVMERISCVCATQVICVSNGVKDTLIADNICNSKKTMVVRCGSANGIDLEKYNPEVIDVNPVVDAFQLKRSDFVLSFVGRIVKDKGVEVLVDAFIRLKNEGLPLKLLLIGEKEDNLDPVSERTEYIISSGNDIIEVGFQKDIRPFMKASQLLLLPSYREGFGLVLMEAGAMGVPVVASDIIGCNNVVISGENGLLCQPYDVISLTNAIRELYQDKQLYNLIKDKTRQSIAERFEKSLVQEDYLRLYNSLAD